MVGQFAVFAALASIALLSIADVTALICCGDPLASSARTPVLSANEHSPIATDARTKARSWPKPRAAMEYRQAESICSEQSLMRSLQTASHGPAGDEIGQRTKQRAHAKQRTQLCFRTRRYHPTQSVSAIAPSSTSERLPTFGKNSSANFRLFPMRMGIQHAGLPAPNPRGKPGLHELPPLARCSCAGTCAPPCRRPA